MNEVKEKVKVRERQIGALANNLILMTFKMNCWPV